MLQPAGKCPNVWTFAQLSPAQIPSNMAPLLRRKGILRAFQRAVQPPRGNAFLAAETSPASSSTLAEPFAQACLISTIQSQTEASASGAPCCAPTPTSLPLSRHSQDATVPNLYSFFMQNPVRSCVEEHRKLIFGGLNE